MNKGVYPFPSGKSAPILANVVLEERILNGDVSTIRFQNIPQDGHDIILHISAAANTATGLSIYLNGDTNTGNYIRQDQYSGVNNAIGAAAPSVYIGAGFPGGGHYEVVIPHYTSVLPYKYITLTEQAMWRSADNLTFRWEHVGVWKSTVPVQSLLLDAGANTIKQGSRLILMLRKKIHVPVV